jgi:hypothetical protein
MLQSERLVYERDTSVCERRRDSDDMNRDFDAKKGM